MLLASFHQSICLSVKRNPDGVEKKWSFFFIIISTVDESVKPFSQVWYLVPCAHSVEESLVKGGGRRAGKSLSSP